MGIGRICSTSSLRQHLGGNEGFNAWWDVAGNAAFADLGSRLRDTACCVDWAPRGCAIAKCRCRLLASFVASHRKLIGKGAGAIECLWVTISVLPLRDFYSRVSEAAGPMGYTVVQRFKL